MMNGVLRSALDKLARDVDSSTKARQMTKISLQKPDFVNSNEA